MIISLIYFQILIIDSYHFFSYIGPGMGGGIIALVLGIIAAFFLGIWGILYYPIKRLLSKKKRNKRKSKSQKK